MYATVRRYTPKGAVEKKTIDDLKRRIDSKFVPIVQDVRGFHSYYVLATGKNELVTIGIFHAVSTYNDYIWPLIVISKKEQQVVSVTLTRFTADHFTEYGPMMAAYALAIVPLLVLFLFGMRAFMEGIVSGSVKA